MTKLLAQFNRAGLILAFMAVVMSCGKKEKEKSAIESGQEPVITEREEYLKKQEIQCPVGAYCPDFIAKIVVFDRGVARYCTGTLVERDIVVTSASCLPSYLRSVDTDCSKEVFFFFPRNSNRLPERVDCTKVLQVSSLEGTKNEYWREDVAILRLNKNIYSRGLRDIYRQGLTDGQSLRLYGIEQLNDFVGVIKKEECEVVHGSYLYPLSANFNSPNVLLAGCAHKNGFRGAALLDSSSRVRGIFSGPSKLTAPLENSDILIKPLKDFIHASNFACAPNLNDTNLGDERECTRELNYALIAEERARLFSDEVRFGPIVRKLENIADTANKYLRLSVKSTMNGQRSELSFVPSCFKNIASWITPVMTDTSLTFKATLPSKTLRKGVDSYGRAVTQESYQEDITYFFDFSPKRLNNSKLSDVFLATRGSDYVRHSAIRACLP